MDQWIKLIVDLVWHHGLNCSKTSLSYQCFRNSGRFTRFYHQTEAATKGCGDHVKHANSNKSNSSWGLQGNRQLALIVHNHLHCKQLQAQVSLPAKTTLQVQDTLTAKTTLTHSGQWHFPCDTNQPISNLSLIKHLAGTQKDSCQREDTCFLLASMQRDSYTYYDFTVFVEEHQGINNVHTSWVYGAHVIHVKDITLY